MFCYILLYCIFIFLYIFFFWPEKHKKTQIWMYYIIKVAWVFRLGWNPKYPKPNYYLTFLRSWYVAISIKDHAINLYPPTCPTYALQWGEMILREHSYPIAIYSLFKAKFETIKCCFIVLQDKTVETFKWTPVTYHLS